MSLYQKLGPQNLTVELVVYRAGLPLLTQKGTALATESTDLNSPTEDHKTWRTDGTKE